jgi:hypothetical protein
MVNMSADILRHELVADVLVLLAGGPTNDGLLYYIIIFMLN